MYSIQHKSYLYLKTIHDSLNGVFVCIERGVEGSNSTEKTPISVSILIFGIIKHMIEVVVIRIIVVLYRYIWEL